MRVLLICLSVLLISPQLFGRDSMENRDKTPVVFATFAGSENQIRYALFLAKSIRAFGGKYCDAPIWVYCTEDLLAGSDIPRDKFSALNAELRSIAIPDDVSWYVLPGMVYSAAAAEDAADGNVAILVFMGSDTIILQEPDEFRLADSVNFGYRPVMHKNICPLYMDELDAYWSKAFEIMGIDRSVVFPMVTPADGDTILPYFNAGMLIVRPERGLLRKWPASFEKLCADSLIRRECEEDSRKRVFTFQVALSGSVLNHLQKNEMTELSDRYNYPIFFNEMFGSKRDFHDITNAVTIRCEGFFDKPIEGWEEILKAPADRIRWLRENLISGTE